MQSQYIVHNNSTLHYRQFGNGQKLLFCFHGYGRESTTFSILERILGSLYTIVAIDVPYHGLTDWKDETILKPRFMVQFLMQIRTRLNMEHEKFTLLGFSMGGRIALHLTQLMAEKVEKLVLLAPDGLNFNFYRWLVSDTMVGNRFVNYAVKHPNIVSWLINKLEKKNVINSGTADFIRYYFEDDKHRMMFYQRYIAMRKFKPNLGLLKRLIKKNQIPVKMMFGRYDRVIPINGGEKLKEGIEDLATMISVDSGHHLLTDAHVRKIAQLIND